MIVDDIFVANLEGDSKFILKVKDNPKTFGIIEKDFNKNRTKELYTIKYYWNNVFQDIQYADDIDKAKDKLKRILKQIIDQTSQENYIKTFENFVNEGQGGERYTKKTWEDPQQRGYINYILYDEHSEYPNGLVVFNGSFVDKQFRGQGIFTELLSGFLSSIPKGVTIQVPVHNKVLRQLFLRHGFKRVKRIEYWGQLSDSWNMEKIQD